MLNKLFAKIDSIPHKELKDIYRHYPCKKCMEIGIIEILKVVIKDIENIVPKDKWYNDDMILANIKELVKKYNKVINK